MRTLMLDSLTPRQRNQLIHRATRSQILTLAEVAANTLAGHLEVEEDARKTLYPYRDALRRIARPKGDIHWTTRRAVILKYSKALKALLSAVGPSLERELNPSDPSDTDDEVQ